MLLFLVLIIIVIGAIITIINTCDKHEIIQKVMTRQDYELLSPYNPIDEEKYKNSIFYRDDDYNERYFEMQALYKKGIDKYLDDVLHLEDKDKNIEKISKSMGVQKSSQDVYRKYNTLDTSYVYLRNYIHIERLEDRYLMMLYKRVIDNNYSVDESIYELIEQTYERVLPYSGTKENHEILLSATSNASPAPYAKVDGSSLIIMISVNIVDIDKFMEQKEKLETYYTNIKWDNEMKLEIIILTDGISLKSDNR